GGAIMLPHGQLPVRDRLGSPLRDRGRRRLSRREGAGARLRAGHTGRRRFRPRCARWHQGVRSGLGPLRTAVAAQLGDTVLRRRNVVSQGPRPMRPRPQILNGAFDPVTFDEAVDTIFTTLDGPTRGWV